MIHNKYIELLEQFIPDYTKEIYGRELVGKVSMSQKSIALALEDLETEGILKSRKSGNIRYFSLNTKNPETKDAMLSAELAKKTDFFKKNQKLSNIFKKDERIVGIFGSYASDTQKDDSDLDIFIIGEKNSTDYKKKGEEYDLEVNQVYFEKEEFKQLCKEKNNLIKEMMRNHIMIFNAEQFINMAWRHFYGFD